MTYSFICGTAVLAGAEALARLHKAPLSCFANFQRSLYLENAAGELVCLGQADLEPGPLNILCTCWPAAGHRPSPAEGIFFRQSILYWPHVQIQLADCPVWRPPQPFCFGAVSRQQLGAFFARRASQDGLSPLGILALHGFPKGSEGAEAFAAPLLQAGRKALSQFAHWLEAPNFPPAVKGLLGLGPGLTPSGDDVLGGALLALQLTARRTQAEALAAAIFALHGQTNRISEAHLGMAAKGLGALALHEFINEALAGLPLSDAVADGLDAIGHSSGWDMALGASLALVLAPEGAFIEGNSSRLTLRGC